MKDRISKTLNMIPLDGVNASVPVKLPVEKPDTIESDINTAKDNITDVIDTAMDAIQKLALIADQSQSPRAFEVLSTLIKTVVDANKDMVGLHKTKQELTGEVEKEAHNVTNNLYVGSTAELQKIIEAKKNG